MPVSDAEILVLAGRYRGLGNALRAASASVTTSRVAVDEAERTLDHVRREVNEARRELLNALERDPQQPAVRVGQEGTDGPA